MAHSKHGHKLPSTYRHHVHQDLSVHTWRGAQWASVTSSFDQWDSSKHDTSRDIQVSCSGICPTVSQLHTATGKQHMDGEGYHPAPQSHLTQAKGRHMRET